MTVGVRQAITELTKLINAALEGETIVITNHGKPLVRLVPEGSNVATAVLVWQRLNHLRSSLALRSDGGSSERDSLLAVE